MDANYIQSLVKQGETQTIEFKKSTAQLHAAFETVCAFLNTFGGSVLIGVTNEGKIIGQEVTDNTRQEIARELSKIEPKPSVEVIYSHLEANKYVIVIQANLNHYLPYVYDSRPFYRNQTTTIRMLQPHYEQLLAEREQLNYSWESVLSKIYTMESLDYEEIRKTIVQAVEANRVPIDALNENTEQILIRLKLLKGKNLTNAAIVLFAKETMPDYPQCMIKMARFKGTDKNAEFIDNQRIYRNAFKIMSAANDFIIRHLPIASFFDKAMWERIDKPALPVLAVREAVINAICHRDYSELSASVSLAIYDDRLEIWNNGSLSPKLKIEDLKKVHESHPRNRLIAKIFYDRKLIEGWGTGTTKMKSLCEDQGLSEPIFLEYSNGFSVVFNFKEPMGASKPIETNGTLDMLTPRQKAIFKILASSEEKTVREIAQQLDQSPALRTVGDDLAYLKKLGMVGIRGRAKTARWFFIKT
jgi:ATP-dependent DNA helicase RecG